MEEKAKVEMNPREKLKDLMKMHKVSCSCTR